MGIEHHACHLYRLAIPLPRPNGNASGRLTVIDRVALPRDLWPTIAARVAAGESLRVLGREYGTSHESIRRLARSADWTATARRA